MNLLMANKKRQNTPFRQTLLHRFLARPAPLLFCVLLARAVCPVQTTAQETGPGGVNGFVYDRNSGEALIGANVFLRDTRIGTATNTSGFYSLPRIPSGEYRLTCTYIGYKPFTETITISSRSPLTLDIYLESVTLLTESVTVTADSVRTSVKLYRKPLSEVTMRPREIQAAPQVVEADLLRTLQSIPGIAAVSDFSSELYVRGGTPDQNLYLIDGTDVYNPEHFFGLFSTFNTDAIKDIRLMKGGFGAEYGGRLSSVLDVTNLDGNRREYTGKASISLLSAKTTMQIPLGRFGSLSGSIRRTYFDQTLGRILDDIPEYYFYDGHLKTYLDLGRSDKLTLSMYKGYDKLDFQFNEDAPDSESLLYDWGNTTFSLRWTHLFSPVLFGNFWVTASRFASDFRVADIWEENNADDLSFKGNFEYYYSQTFNLKLGYEFKKLKALYNSEFPGGKVAVVQKPRHLATYVQAEWRPTPLLETQAGLRHNWYRNDGKTLLDLDPRLSLKYRVSDISSMKLAFGVYHQYLSKIPRAFVADIWSSSDRYYDQARSLHYIAGYQREIADHLGLEVEAYYKDYTNLYFFDPFFWTDLKVTEFTEEGFPIYSDTRGLYDRGEGYAYGLEFLLRRDTPPVSGWISLSLGRAMNRIRDRNQGKAFPPRHDRLLNLHIVGNMDIRNTWRWIRGRALASDRKRWNLGFGVVYASGQPLTTISSVYVTRQLPDQEFYHGYNLYPTERNNFRLPAYIRLDISLTFVTRWKGVTFEPYIQVFNLLNRKNVWFIDYEDELKEQMIIQNINTVGMLPILPSLGISFLF
jgi:hypothetical protein